MSFTSVSVLVLLAVASASANLEDYCKICRDHTMCRYQGTGAACENIGSGGVSESDKRKILDLHNSYRTTVAKGLESRGLGGPQPSAANMKKMNWDNELAEIAQRWADQCLFQHDTCRDTSKSKVGQNLYWSWSMPITTATNWTAAIQSWYEEVMKFNPQNVPSFQFQPSTGHYTQVVWADTNLVGCGTRSYGPNKLYVCNYSPAGNWLNQPMYIIGPPCSKCPAGMTCNDGLCDGESRRRPQGTGRNPSYSDRQFPDLDQQFTGGFRIRGGFGPYGDGRAQMNLIDSSVTALEDITTTEVPISFNIIDDLDIINNDEEIKREIEQLKLRILELVQNITEKRNTRFSPSE